MKLDFNWQVTGQKNNDDILSVELYGHEGFCSKSFEANDSGWLICVDGNKYSGLPSKKGAQAYVEKLIRNKIEDRITLAKQEMSAFSLDKSTPLAIIAKLGPNYLPLSDFNRYIESNAKPALAVVGTNLKNPNTLNQVAAKMLGYKSYEALQPMHHREQMINEALHVERCPFQNNRITIKAGNIIVVFDNNTNQILFRALTAGQETVFVTEDNCFNLFDFGDIPMNMDISLKNYLYSPQGGDLLYPQIDVVFTDNSAEQHALVVKRTHEGVILDMIYNYKGSAGSIESHAAAFDDAYGEYDDVDQANAIVDGKPINASDGSYYQWLKPVLHDEQDVRFAHINPTEEMDISDLIFESQDKAIEAGDSGDWGIDAEDLKYNDAVLVKVTKSVVGNAASLLQDA